MSYTNTDLVARHINLNSEQADIQRNYPVEFIDDDWISLPGNRIIEGTLRVKTITGLSPEYQEIVMNEAMVSLAKGELVPNSCTVAADMSLSRIYKENIDFTIDHPNGTITRRADGAINAGATLSVWYHYYSLFDENSDYEVDYNRGRIRRPADSDINPGQIVLVDYLLSNETIADEILAAAVNEANAIVDGEIDTSQDFGADFALQTAATYLAVALTCRIAAAADIRSGDSVKQSASSWISLSESYRADYESLIKKFRPGRIKMSRPTHS